jgi:HD-GYP domain-containing protein (c-di-GMP phosphodiesterase class II)
VSQDQFAGGLEGVLPGGAVPQTASGVVTYSSKQMKRAREVLSRIYAMRRVVRMFPLDNPVVTESVASLMDSVLSFHNEGVDIHLAFFEGEILLGEQILTEESVMFDQLVRDLASIGVGSLSLRRGVTIDELGRAVALLAMESEEVDAAGGMQALLDDARLEHIDLGEVRVIEKAEELTGDPTEEARAAYNGAVCLLREMDRLLRTKRAVSAGKVKGAVRSLVDNVLSNPDAMLQLTGLKDYDEYTFYHSANVAILSLALGSMVTTNYRFLSSLGVGALLHDLGKLAVDLEILNKPGALSPEEWAHVRLHPVHGAQMSSILPGVDKAAIVTILEHHMRFDGSGYPKRGEWRQQHLASRIVAVADSYDAMTSRRSYSAARVQDEAMLMLVRSAGSSLDPGLVRLFIALMGIYPPRSAVRLSSDEVAVVLTANRADPVRPLVRVIASAEGELIEPRDVDLAAAEGLSVRGCIDPRMMNIQVEDFV